MNTCSAPWHERGMSVSSAANNARSVQVSLVLRRRLPPQDRQLVAQQKNLSVLPRRRTPGQPQPCGYLNGEKEHEAQAHETRSSTNGCLAASREPVMTCPYGIFGNHRGGDGHKEVRDGFTSSLFRYTRATKTPVYDPISGNNIVLVPARGLMYSFITRWMRDFRVDGVRMDSIENVANWDFVGGFKDRARQLWQDRWQAAGLGAEADERFLVVGEELSEPMQLLTQNRLDGLWNDSFRQLVRAAILGESGPGEATFEWTVRKAIDCRLLGFTDGAQAVNYITSHDVEGFRRERLFNMLVSCGLHDLDLQKRIELAFVSAHGGRNPNDAGR
jgi:hypothetical protein